MFTTQVGELVSLSWRTGTLGSKRSRLRISDPSNNSNFKIKHMSAALSILFTLSNGKAQELHEITFNQISIFATVSNHFPLFGSCHHGNHKCITLKEASLNDHCTHFISTSLIDGGTSPPAPLSGFLLKTEFKYPNP